MWNLYLISIDILFVDINVWLYNGPNQAWDTALLKFSANVQPVEAKIADKLKPRLHNTSTKQVK